MYALSKLRTMDLKLLTSRLATTGQKMAASGMALVNKVNSSTFTNLLDSFTGEANTRSEKGLVCTPFSGPQVGIFVLYTIQQSDAHTLDEEVDYFASFTAQTEKSRPNPRFHTEEKEITFRQQQEISSYKRQIDRLFYEEDDSRSTSSTKSIKNSEEFAAFYLPRKSPNNNDVTLGYVKQNFPLCGCFWFRFKYKIPSEEGISRGFVWVDVWDDEALVPTFNGEIFMKVLPLPFGGEGGGVGRSERGVIGREGSSQVAFWRQSFDVVPQPGLMKKAVGGVGAIVNGRGEERQSAPSEPKVEAILFHKDSQTNLQVKDAGVDVLLNEKREVEEDEDVENASKVEDENHMKEVLVEGLNVWGGNTRHFLDQDDGDADASDIEADSPPLLNADTHEAAPEVMKKQSPGTEASSFLDADLLFSSPKKEASSNSISRISHAHQSPVNIVQRQREMREKRDKDFEMMKEKTEVSDVVKHSLDVWRLQPGAVRKDIRALLSTLQEVLWPSSGWKAVEISTLMMDSSEVKKVYRRALLVCHPDKQQQASAEQQYRAHVIFEALNYAYKAHTGAG